ncbi:MAG: DinB family protein [Akkermansiaceae bacterium]|nr:DinB family protein [Akkermansiaceae bacterium]
MLELLRDHSEAALSQPVLIKRLPGLEDSSRYWSLLMVADHLRIVNRDITEVIVSLCAGQRPAREASIAGVKPSPLATQAVIGEFEQGCRDFASTVAALPDLKTDLKFAHPWFGPMDAATWHFMVGFHMQLHHKQMKLILAGLPKA